jgi:hypothetical protein
MFTVIFLYKEGKYWVGRELIEIDITKVELSFLYKRKKEANDKSGCQPEN